MPFRLDEMRREVACYATWYNEHRSHPALRTRTPLEVYRALPPAIGTRWTSSPGRPLHGQNRQVVSEVQRVERVTALGRA